MRACALRAGFSRCGQLKSFVLGNPKAWLGTAYHKVMELLPTILGDPDPVARADAIWAQEISRLEYEASAHPLNARFGTALSWKGYFLVHATMRLRVQEAVAGGTLSSASRGSPTTAARELYIKAGGGKLRGKIDMIRGQDLIDYKTGDIFEDDEISGVLSLKPSYVRQLQMYAWLVHSSIGQWPQRGLLYPLAGPPVEVPLVLAECIAQAEDAMRRLDEYNTAVSDGTNISAMASPSPEACRWCPFKAVCPAFWTTVKPEWAGQLDGEVIRGRLDAPPQPLATSGAYSLVVNVEGGTIEAAESVRLAPLSIDVHSSMSTLTTGERIVLTRLGRRSDGRFFPMLQTLLIPLKELEGI
jgi:hypothetical protein